MREKMGFTMAKQIRSGMCQTGFLTILFLSTFIVGMFSAEAGDFRIERKILKYIASDEFRALQSDRRCPGNSKYHVYLIDNFDLKFDIVPGVRTSHGEMVLKLLEAGREDIRVTVLNIALCKGLAQVINDILAGACVDAVVSSVPGSNYTYDQISSLLGDGVSVKPENIAFYSGALTSLLRRIAFDGYPSVKWLEVIDVNSVKLRNDARKFVFIEALGRFGVPVVLPYGNLDATHNGKVKSVNLLSLAANAKIYSALGSGRKAYGGVSLQSACFRRRNRGFRCH